jgi:lipoprotein-anchoring transpeptidase ErfK/SrfK
MIFSKPILSSLLAGFTVVFAVIAGPSVASAKGTVVSLSANVNVEPGTIIIRMSQRMLYFVIDGQHAIRYPIATPKSGMEWSGYAHVTGTYLAPAWAPPAIVKRDHPELPDYIPGGAPNNPMGAAALTLDRDEIAIHGTTAKMRSSIGTSASYGCIRMLNEDVSDLYERVETGALVIVKH